MNPTSVRKDKKMKIILQITEKKPQRNGRKVEETDNIYIYGNQYLSAKA